MFAGVCGVVEYTEFPAFGFGVFGFLRGDGVEDCWSREDGGAGAFEDGSRGKVAGVQANGAECGGGPEMVREWGGKRGR